MTRLMAVPEKYKLTIPVSGRGNGNTRMVICLVAQFVHMDDPKKSLAKTYHDILVKSWTIRYPRLRQAIAVPHLEHLDL